MSTTKPRGLDGECLCWTPGCDECYPPREVAAICTGCEHGCDECDPLDDDDSWDDPDDCHDCGTCEACVEYMIYEDRSRTCRWRFWWWLSGLPVRACRRARDAWRATFERRDEEMPF